MQNNESQKERNQLVLAVIAIKKLFPEHKYFLFQKTGGSCPMTKCPLCGRLRVAMGLKSTEAGSIIHFMDVCTGRFDKGKSYCNYYFKAEGPKDKITINQYGNRSARIIANETEPNLGVMTCNTNDTKFKQKERKEVK